jgi:hypothetical protein
MKEYFSYMPLNATEETPFKETDDDPYRMVDPVLDVFAENGRLIVPHTKR